MILRSVDGVAGAGGNPAVLGWGAGVLGSSPTIRFLFPWYSDQLAEVGETGLVVPRSGTIQNLRVRHNIPNGNGTLISYIVRVSGVDSTVKVDLASNVSTGSDTVNSVAVTAGDYVSVKVTKAASVGASPRNVAVTAELV